MMDKYASFKIFPEARGNRVWREEVHQWEPRKLTREERQHGPRYNAPDGIYIVTVSEGTPPEGFEMARLLNLASRGSRSTKANGFVPTGHYDSALAVVSGRVVGGVVADRGRAIWFAGELRADGGCRKSRMADDGGGPVIMDLWVHPAHRRRGLGRQLLTAVAAHFGRSVEQIGFRFPIRKNAVRLLWSMGLRKVEGTL
jgi:GNAT superfamily N-acetyltransferase